MEWLVFQAYSFREGIKGQNPQFLDDNEYSFVFALEYNLLAIVEQMSMK